MVNEGVSPLSRLPGCRRHGAEETLNQVYSMKALVARMSQPHKSIGRRYGEHVEINLSELGELNLAGVTGPDPSF